MKEVLEHKDDAVAAVIGALLTFVIVTSLMGAYLLWYIPSSGQQNDIKYMGEVQNSFFQLQNKMNNASPYFSQFVVQDFPLGVQGTPPFTSSTDSQISFENYSSSFTNLHYSLSVNVSYYGVKRTLNYTVNENSTGTIALYPQTSFVTPTNIYYQNDIIIANQQGSNYSQVLGVLPLQLSSSANGLFLNASTFGFTGNSTSLGGFQSTILTMQYSDVNQVDVYRGENITISNLTGGYTTAVVGNITLNSFYYNLTTPYANALNYSFSQLYGGGLKASGSVSGGYYWNFSVSSLFRAHLNKSMLSIYSVAKIRPYGVGLNYYILRLLQI